METFKKEIFEQLGNLFYALAIEQHMALIASGELKMAVRKDWLGGANGDYSDSKVSEASHLIGLTIDSLQSEQTPSSVAYGAFEKFFRQHREQFSHALKQQILETADTLMSILPPDGETNQCYESLKALLAASSQPSADFKAIA